MTKLLLPLPRQDAEVQRVSVLMTDLVGSTRLARELPLAQYAALMTEFVQLLILTCEAWGGRALQHQGDSVVACWPEEYAPKAVRCALETPLRAERLEIARALGVRLQVRSGVASGLVMVGEVGAQVTAYGLPLNLARRMCDAALAGETLVCADVQARCLSAQAPLSFEPRLHLPHLRDFDEDCPTYTAQPALSRLNPAQMKVI